MHRKPQPYSMSPRSHPAPTPHYKCSSCGELAASTDPNPVPCAGCKDLHYCNPACQKAHKSAHSPECETKHHLVLPPQAVNGISRYITLRIQSGATLARSGDAIFHLKMETRNTCGPVGIRYLGAFVEIGVVKEKIWEVIDGKMTAVPSREIVDALLDGAGVGAPDVAEVRVPMSGGKGEMRFSIVLEEDAYIKDCIRRSIWTQKKLLYTVIVEKSRFSTDLEASERDNMRGKQTAKLQSPSRNVTDIKIKRTYASQTAAQELVSTILRSWQGRVSERGRGFALAEKDGTYMAKGVRYDDKGQEVSCVQVVTRNILRAGAKTWNGKDGEVVGDGAAPEDATTKGAVKDDAAENAM
jgi:hypothetical protein